MCEKENNSDISEQQKFIYDKVFEELNRARDWPIKILVFSSAIYFSLIGFIQIKTTSLSCSNKNLIILLLSIFLVLSVIVIIRQHLNYLDYRNIQITLQKKMGIYEWSYGNKKIFPKHWEKLRRKNIITGWQGWLFYAFYLTAIYIITIALLLSK